MIGELLTAVLVVIVGSALASGTEAALFSVSVIKVRQLADQGTPAARVLLQIRQNMSRPIATIVILNNIFNIVGSIVVGGIAATALGNEWLGLFSALLTLAVIIGSEIIPKNLGERYAEPIALATARPVALLTKLMFPLVWLIEHIVSPITRGKPRLVTNEAEIQLLAQIGQQEGSIELDEAQLIQRVFRLNDATAGSIMTPRVSMTYVHGDETLAEVRDQVIASPHSRILVIGDSIDEVQGVTLKSELLVALVNGQTDTLLADLAREVLFVPEMVRADQLMATFREKREHLAVVVDEFGGVAGVVTLEDVLEVLTGEIVDETDLVVDLQEWARQRRKILLERQEQPESR
jgi:CBS domain containing-hemolysin-like protein